MRGRTLCAAFLAAVAVLQATGCQAGAPTPDSGQPSLKDTAWILQSYGEPGAMKTSLSDHLPTLYFETDTLRGFAGCNTCTGTYSATPSGQLAVTDLACTEMFCTDAGVMDQEKAYLEILLHAEQYSVEGSKLIITGGGRTLVLLNNCLCSD